MFEVKITIEATALAQAINNLAAALSGAMPCQTPAQPQTVANPMPQQAAPAYPGQTPPPAQNMTPVSGVPLSQPPQYAFDQIQKAGATLMDAGRVDDLMNLLHSFGVNAITDLRPELLGAFATALRGLGAKI